MSDEIDPGLKRVFAQTAEAPADEAFVAEVASKTSRLRRWCVIGTALGLILVAIAVATGLGLAAASIGPIAAALSASPFGWIAGLAFVGAGALCVRALAGGRAG